MCYSFVSLLGVDIAACVQRHLCKEKMMGIIPIIGRTGKQKGSEKKGQH
jgi:hypothetical protein